LRVRGSTLAEGLLAGLTSGREETLRTPEEGLREEPRSRGGGTGRALKVEVDAKAAVFGFWYGD
jgi:hypothetical protein